MKREDYIWKVCLPQKGNGGSNPSHSARNPFGDGGCENVIIGGRMMRNVAKSGKTFDTRLTNRKNSARMFDKKKEYMKRINVGITWRDRCGRDGTAPLLLSVSYDRKTSYLPVGVSLRPEHWDKERKKVVNHPRAATINSFVQSLIGRAEDAVLELQRRGGVRGWDVFQVKESIANILYPKEVDNSVLAVMEQFMEKKDKPNTKDKYRQTKLHIERWLGSSARKLEFADITPGWLKDFDRHMAQVGLGVNSRSIHMRNIRTVFNYAIDYNLTDAKYPFRQFKIKSAQVQPMALTLEQLRKLWSYDPGSNFPGQRYWLDIWKLMFTLIGINMADLWLLDKISQGRINYARQKTGRLYSIKVEPEALALINEHKGRKTLVNVSSKSVSVNRATVAINKRLKEVADKIGLPPITAYTARYTWATLAQSIDIPIEVISQALGHSYGMAVTQGYIMPDRRKVDEANRKVLDLLLNHDDKDTE